jgi:hypothetical protein
MERPQENNNTLTPSPSPVKGEGSSDLKGTSPKKIDKASMISLSLELGYIIAIPLVVLGLLGKWGDRHWNHEFPWMTLLGIVLAIVATTIWLIRKLKNYVK